MGNAPPPRVRLPTLAELTRVVTVNTVLSEHKFIGTCFFILPRSTPHDKVFPSQLAHSAGLKCQTTLCRLCVLG